LNFKEVLMMIPMATGVLKHLDDEEDPNALLYRQCSRTFSRMHMKLDHGIGSTEVYNYDDDIVDPEAASREITSWHTHNFLNRTKRI
jgi:hypothetical protein